jgi:zinc-binding in reverse transcriptase
MPIKYFGLPLTILKPPKSAFIPLITSVQKRCKGWPNGRLLVSGGHVLSDSVLNALPLHYMQVFILPSRVIAKIQKITRRYLWRGTQQSFSEGHCLVAWETIISPHVNGGLSITDLRLQNKSLIIKWLWVVINEKDSLWAQTLTKNGIKKGWPKSSKEGSPILDMAKTAFVWLLLHNKLNTVQNLVKKGWPAMQRCALCLQRLLETVDHLFSTCAFTADVYNTLLASRSQQKVYDDWTHMRDEIKQTT